LARRESYVCRSESRQGPRVWQCVQYNSKRSQLSRSEMISRSTTFWIRFPEGMALSEKGSEGGVNCNDGSIGRILEVEGIFVAAGRAGSFVEVKRLSHVADIREWKREEIRVGPRIEKDIKDQFLCIPIESRIGIGDDYSHRFDTFCTCSGQFRGFGGKRRFSRRFVVFDRGSFPSYFRTWLSSSATCQQLAFDSSASTPPPRARYVWQFAFTLQSVNRVGLMGGHF
jgi:hypothetical protein